MFHLFLSLLLTILKKNPLSYSMGRFFNFLEVSTFKKYKKETKNRSTSS